MGERKRGRRGQADRRRRLALYPICAECKKRGLIRPTRIIDHIQPLAFGGLDIDENCQGLCLMCNAIKTAAENAGGDGVSNWPAWLQPSAVPLEIVCGPPCSGKSTYVASRSRDGDAVVDLDAILARLDPSYRPWSGGLDPAALNRAIRVRNAMLGALSRMNEGRAWFVVAAPTAGERDWWSEKLGGSVVLLDPGDEVCKERARKRGTPLAVAAVDGWRRSHLLRWSPPKAKLPKRGADDDGYPLEG